MAFYFGKPRPHLREYTPPPKDRSPLVSVILPARNEAGNIERCLRSLTGSEYPSLEIIVVDDRSTDDTAKIAARFATADPRVRVLAGRELPEGWYGKPWACWQGWQEAKGELLLFTDADTEHGPELLGRAVAAREAARADLLTVMPRQEMAGFWERVVQPYFFLMLGLRFGSLARINRNRNPRHAIANGQFILVTRQSYQRVGGHQSVHDTVIEDLMIAVRYLEAGRSHLFVNAEDDMTTRMYDSLGGLVEGWSKNFFMGALATVRLRPLAYAGVLGALIVPVLSLAPIGVAAVGLCRGDAGLVAAGSGAYGAGALLFGLFLAAARAPVWYGLLYPVGAPVVAHILLRSAVRGTRVIEWKGRRYSA